MKEAYGNSVTILNKTKYQDYKWQVYGDLIMLVLLVGGFTMSTEQ